MQCESCHAKDATVHLTQVTEEGVRKLHLCETCAEKAGLGLPDASALADALLVGMGGAVTKKDAGVGCPKCHLKMSDFKRTGRLGCPECYRVFREPLRSLVRSMQRDDHHVGKTPRGLPPPAEPGLPDDPDRLREDLARAIAREAFEEAAGIRDRIRKIESGPGAAPEAKAP